MATPKRLAGPAHMASSAANILSPTSGIVNVIRQIHVANKDSSARTFRLYVGATGASAAGTEIEYDKNVPIGDHVDLHFPNGLRLSDTEYLTGLASAATALTITVLGEQIVP